MEFPEMYQVYEVASRHVEVLERRLCELQQHPQSANDQEFNYIRFKVSVAESVKKMYEQYRNEKWSKLQQQATDILQEVLDSQYPNIPENEDQLLTPYSTPRRHNHTDASFLHIPPPLSPLRDLDDILLSPPNSLETQDRHTDRFHSSRNLSILFNEMPRDM